MGNTKPENILVSPLCWGLGHATRCIPVINELQKKSCNITILANKEIINYYKTHFQNIK